MLIEHIHKILNILYRMYIKINLLRHNLYIIHLQHIKILEIHLEDEIIFTSNSQFKLVYSLKIKHWYTRYNAQIHK